MELIQQSKKLTDQENERLLFYHKHLMDLYIGQELYADALRLSRQALQHAETMAADLPAKRI